MENIVCFKFDLYVMMTNIIIILILGFHHHVFYILHSPSSDYIYPYIYCVLFFIYNVLLILTTTYPLLSYVWMLETLLLCQKSITWNLEFKFPTLRDSVQKDPHKNLYLKMTNHFKMAFWLHVLITCVEYFKIIIRRIKVNFDIFLE